MNEMELITTVREMLQTGKGILAMDVWNGEKANRAAAQKNLYHRAYCNGKASTGNYTPEMEKTDSAQKYARNLKGGLSP